MVIFHGIILVCDIFKATLVLDDVQKSLFRCQITGRIKGNVYRPTCAVGWIYYWMEPGHRYLVGKQRHKFHIRWARQVVELMDLVTANRANSFTLFNQVISTAWLYRLKSCTQEPFFWISDLSIVKLQAFIMVISHKQISNSLRINQRQASLNNDGWQFAPEKACLKLRLQLALLLAAASIIQPNNIDNKVKVNNYNSLIRLTNNMPSLETQSTSQSDGEISDGGKHMYCHDFW